MGLSECVSTLFPEVQLSVLLSAELTPGTEQTVFFTAGLLTTAIALRELNRFTLTTSRSLFSRAKIRNSEYLSLLSVLIVSSLSAGLFLWICSALFQPAYRPKVMIDCFIVLVSFSMLVTVFGENQALSRKRAKDQELLEASQRMQKRAELDLLRDQIDPHFFFNSLNTMSYLIDHDPEGAKLFNDALASVYRYILLNKNKDLVSVKEELAFIRSYFSLLTIRYPQGLHMSIETVAVPTDKTSILPISLQLLVENAIKHNNFSKELPLHIRIGVTEDHVTVRNVIQKKRYEEPGCRYGLQNLSSRYQLTTGENITVLKHPDHFLVKLPLIKGDQNV